MAQTKSFLACRLVADIQAARANPANLALPAIDIRELLDVDAPDMSGINLRNLLPARSCEGTFENVPAPSQLARSKRAMHVLCVPGSWLNIPFYRLSEDSSSVLCINWLVPQKGMVSLDGTRRYLAVQAYVICPAILMTLCAYPHMGYYQTGHLAVR